ncbi:hypothetical protein ACOBR2_04560 [Telmatobacter bradus]|uniref:hypothetical protein n=1 Tax=Telmatobacter bradus TaxID=474953 RepID=UPI003B428138
MQIAKNVIKIQRIGKKRMPTVKVLFWIYCLLLVFEGSLRKWVAPGLSAPLLVIRDPFGVLILWESIRSHRWPKQYSVLTGSLAVFFLSLAIIQVLTDTCPWFVCVYGIRSYLLPFPVAFAISNIITKEDIKKICRFAMFISLPMTALYYLQYKSGASSWINLGAYEGGSQIDYVGLHVRAAGTFSFVTGAIGFQSFLAGLVLYAMTEAEVAKRWLVYAALTCLIFSVPFVGARTLVFMYIAEIGCLVVASFLGISHLMQTLKLLIPILIIGIVVTVIPSFKEALGSLTERFSSAEQSQGSTGTEFYRRMAGPYITWIEQSGDARAFGVGMGRGAAAITQLMVGRPTFETGEDELTRNILELGYIWGIGFVLFRMVFACVLFSDSIIAARENKMLALFLLPSSISAVMFGILEQPTGQGFMIISLALMIAAMRKEAMPQSVRIIPQNRLRLNYEES